MADTREKLIRLLIRCGVWGANKTIGDIADYLIVNGVTIPVNCKDCKYRIYDDDFVSNHFCTKRPSNGGIFCEDDDFCSYGEKRRQHDETNT